MRWFRPLVLFRFRLRARLCSGSTAHERLLRLRGSRYQRHLHQLRTRHDAGERGHAALRVHARHRRVRRVRRAARQKVAGGRRSVVRGRGLGDQDHVGQVALKSRIV